MMNKTNEGDFKNGKKISALQKKISHLRFFIYVLVAALGLMTCVSLLWIYSTFTTPSPFETYYSTAPNPPKALLYLSPKEGNYRVGDEFSVDVLLNTAGSNVVVAAAYLSYNKERIEAVSINIADSIFEMSAEEKIDTKEGKIKITLGKPTPGVNVYNGKVATVHFKAIGPISPYKENIYFDFTKGSSLFSTVIIDDKKGTNILNDVRGAKVFID